MSQGDHAQQAKDRVDSSDVVFRALLGDPYPLRAALPDAEVNITGRVECTLITEVTAAFPDGSALSWSARTPMPAPHPGNDRG